MSMTKQTKHRPMRRDLDYEYYRWIISQIAVPEDSTSTYEDLFTRMHDTEFVWHIPHDDNRLQDAVDLRVEFIHGSDFTMERGVSVLEVLVALSRRCAFTGGGYAPFWAWTLIENLRLHKASDPLIGRKADRVDDILEALVWRTYEFDGRGGFFPLKDATEDQTKQELWVQMNTYINEKFPIT